MIGGAVSKEGRRPLKGISLALRRLVRELGERVRELAGLLWESTPRRQGDYGRIDKKLLQRALPLFRPLLRRLLPAAFLVIPATLFSVPQPYLSRYLVDDVLVEQTWSTLYWLAPLFLGLMVMSVVLGWFQGIYVFNVQQRALADLQHQVFSHLVRLPKAYFDESNTGQLIARVSAETTQMHGALLHLCTALGPELVRAFGAAAIMFYLNWRMAIVAFVALPLLVVITRFSSRKLRNTARESFEKGAAVYEELEQTVCGH